MFCPPGVFGSPPARAPMTNGDDQAAREGAEPAPGRSFQQNSAAHSHCRAEDEGEVRTAQLGAISSCSCGAESSPAQPQSLCWGNRGLIGTAKAIELLLLTFPLGATWMANDVPGASHHTQESLEKGCRREWSWKMPSLTPTARADVEGGIGWVGSGLVFLSGILLRS